MRISRESEATYLQGSAPFCEVLRLQDLPGVKANGKRLVGK